MAGLSEAADQPPQVSSGKMTSEKAIMGSATCEDADRSLFFAS
jgi:hypothetical protein